jgi:hypothetical protein
MKDIKDVNDFGVRRVVCFKVIRVGCVCRVIRTIHVITINIADVWVARLEWPIRNRLY